MSPTVRIALLRRLARRAPLRFGPPLAEALVTRSQHVGSRPSATATDRRPAAGTVALARKLAGADLRYRDLLVDSRAELGRAVDTRRTARPPRRRLCAPPGPDPEPRRPIDRTQRDGRQPGMCHERYAAEA
ncbi:hypothetical protein [Micromonospora sp. DPT]|uniref:hypothetical protein n=1 Tax=Micromonospora sp. DPT TaxID=3142975 RepID=UPI00320A5C6A